MGCDIHPMLERKYGSKWIGVDLFNGMHKSVYDINEEKKLSGDHGVSPYLWPEVQARNYRRFAKLAGVRGDGPAPKGLPEDASELARAEAERVAGDAHSHSWVTLKEAAQIFVETDRDAAELLLDSDPRMRDPYRYYFGVWRSDAKEDEYRLVFWFDN